MRDSNDSDNPDQGEGGSAGVSSLVSGLYAVQYTVNCTLYNQWDIILIITSQGGEAGRYFVDLERK